MAHDVFLATEGERLGERYGKRTAESKQHPPGPIRESELERDASYVFCALLATRRRRLHLYSWHPQRCRPPYGVYRHLDNFLKQHHRATGFEKYRKLPLSVPFRRKKKTKQSHKSPFFALISLPSGPRQMIRDKKEPCMAVVTSWDSLANLLLLLDSSVHLKFGVI